LSLRLRTAAVFVLLLPLAALLQVTISPTVSALRGAPDVVCVVVVGFALVRGPIAGACAGWCVGLLLDVLTWQPLGLSALVYTLLGYAAGRLGGRFANAPVRPLIVIAVGTVAARVGGVAVAFLIGVPGAVDLGKALSIGAISSAAFDVLLAIPLYPAIRLALGGRRKKLEAPTLPPPSSVTDDATALLV
jgi:rod shape-determining protein MreD